MKKIIMMLFAGSFSFTLMAFVTPETNDPWPVPEKYLKMANPVKSDAASIAHGKELFIQHCQSCHGKKGKGDGPKAAQLDTESGDFSTAAFHKQPDGSLFYKTSEGRKDMPSYKKKISDANDIWAIVNFIRTLK
jgi:mono/diheme cytochrome c family protein